MVMVIEIYEEYENREIEIIVNGRYVINAKTGEAIGEVFSYE